MPRRARQESSTSLYHVIMRGSNRSWIFQKDQYKKLIKKLIFEQEASNHYELYAWCIMDNHVHIVMKCDKEKMYKAMFNINNAFAKKYNKQEKHYGHVFENRYKSECIEDEGYFLKVIRYVHKNNPVKAKMVEKAYEYRWSSYREILSGDFKLKSIDVLGYYFDGDIDKFIGFHNEIDDMEYLDIKEDIMKYREEKAQEIIEYCCKKHDIRSIIEIHKNYTLRTYMILDIIERSHLPLRRVAEIMGMSYSGVYRCTEKIVEVSKTDIK